MDDGPYMTDDILAAGAMAEKLHQTHGTPVWLLKLATVAVYTGHKKFPAGIEAVAEPGKTRDDQ
jgi:hypothetical protein